MDKTVVVTEYVDSAGLELLRSQVCLIYLPDATGVHLSDVIAEAHGLGVRLARITPELMDVAPRLQVIAKHGVGVDNIDVAAATARRIPVVTTPGANSVSVAEHILSMMLCLANRICAADAALKSGRFRSREDYVGVELRGKTLGVVGMGRIGCETARIASLGFGMDVCYFDPMLVNVPDGANGYRRLNGLDELLCEADFVVLCLPLTPETSGLIGPRELSLMKPTAYIVNTSRGGLIDEDALHEALMSGQIAGAGADAFVKEPVPSDHPLLRIDNFIATPHVGGATREAMKRMSTDMAEEILRVLRGEQPCHAVNPEVLW